MAAARTLIDRGAEVTLASVADEAGISRATTYRYFSDPAALALEAVLDGMVGLPGTSIPESTSARLRVHAVCSYWLGFYRSHENRMRLLAARTIAPSAEEAPRYRRIARRLPMFTEALKPAARLLGKSNLRELAVALAASTGFETYTTMKDILLLKDADIQRTSTIIVEALLEKYGVA